MKKIIMLSRLALVAALVIMSCNKTKISAKRLDGGEWHVKELSVDGVNEAELPEWNIGECDGYKESCLGDWVNHEGGKSKFVWQFREKAEKFEISNQSELSGDHATDEAVLQCQSFSGTYDVISRKKKEMEFKTTSAIGFTGKTVIIKIEKH